MLAMGVGHCEHRLPPKQPAPLSFSSPLPPCLTLLTGPLVGKKDVRYTIDTGAKMSEERIKAAHTRAACIHSEMKNDFCLFAAAGDESWRRAEAKYLL
ncbi:hypothetical protein BaRGS_00019997 [Batillaria attramentaria]|uniref:Uncharacterized protein n=1 Tax=Batillaria attramentaria TaxID=370345 RepID=A0ABD0KN81_9CAEN